MLVDNLSIIVQAGNGGNGAATFLRDARTARGGPDGGNGGRGGSIYFKGSPNITDLRQFLFQKKILAVSGVNGGNRDKYGKNASDLTVELPIGTTVTDSETKTTIEITDASTPILIAKGGRGGRGNVEFKSATNQAPMKAETGGTGERKKLQLELRLIAEVGLVGMPNAGKSSLLAKLTNAKPLIGDYPFTTIEPNIGMLGKYALADIPGLIEGASRGRGLGTKFLRHIEKTKLLIHCIDSSVEDPLLAYETVRKEFAAHNPTLLEKPEIILLTKIDLITENRLKEITKIFKKTGKKVYHCSIHDEKSVKSLNQTVLKLLIVNENKGDEKTLE